MTSKEQKIRKLIEKDPMMQMGDDYFHKLEVIPTGILSLDLALGVGGYPRGCIIDIFGEPYSGKSLITLLAIREVQKMGGIPAILDAERAYSKSKKWLITNGVDTSKLLFIKDPIAEKALDKVCDIVSQNLVDLVVIDSVPALIPSASYTRKLADGTKIAAAALMMTEALQKLTPLVDNSKTVCIFINQLRAKINTSSYMQHLDDSEKSTGGNALRFYASVRIGVKKVGGSTIKEGDEKIGHRIRTIIYKNKVASPFKSAEFDIFYERGVDITSQLPRAAFKLGIVKREGITFFYGEYKWKGKEEIGRAHV